MKDLPNLKHFLYSSLRWTVVVSFQSWSMVVKSCKMWSVRNLSASVLNDLTKCDRSFTALSYKTHIHSPSFPPAAAADLWVTEHSSDYEVVWWQRPERSNMFLLGFSLSWRSRCFCQVCSVLLAPVLPAGAAELAHADHISLFQKHLEIRYLQIINIKVCY